MSARPEILLARATAELSGDVLEVTLSGSWQITERRPSWQDVLADRKPTTARFRMEEIEQWDSSLLLFLFEAQRWCRTTGVHFDVDALPEKTRLLLGQLATAHETSAPFDRSESFFTSV